MRGTITIADAGRDEGRVQAEDGRILSFRPSEVKGGIPPEEGMEADFACVGDEARDLKLMPDGDFRDRRVFYEEPEQIGLSRSGVPEGYELIDRAAHAVSAEHRKLLNAKWALINFARECGGNVILNFREEKFVKHSIGFALNFNRVSGIVAVIGRRSARSESSLYDLKRRLNHRRLDSRHELERSVFLGKRIISVIGGILLIIFVAGFLYTL